MGIERVEERRGFAEKTQSVLRRQKDDETVKMKGLRVFQTFLEAQTTAKDDR